MSKYILSNQKHLTLENELHKGTSSKDIARFLFKASNASLKEVKTYDCPTGTLRTFYSCNHEAYFRRFLEDPEFPLDNNDAEGVSKFLCRQTFLTHH